ncbi:FG-GAP-like repeat-containing protein [Streptomyces sp. NBC_00233]|uniref:FG-GAP-like repeat-containing protein n=1 Tax=Streptomyces sp. NBC_00233 TaxID=2975686 RepID=UPI00224F29B5|nr:FG-GAP-like repeat-containing protein [Streptomyces sp. NBC_00233]MCX5233083.1 FG-GAP-like repeat-containing protein [Streptomyces sp. NBC_00233]
MDSRRLGRPPLPLVAVVAAGSLLASLVGQGVTAAAAPGISSIAADAPVLTPPVKPKTMTIPSAAVGGGTDRSAYLPGSSSVGPDGSYVYSIPLAVPDGRAGVQPGLSLEYSSRGGNGLLGMGWAVAGLSSIERCHKTLAAEGSVSGVNFDSSDAFCLDGQKLVPVKGFGQTAPKANGADGAEYRTETDSFDRVRSSVTVANAAKGPDSFTVQTKSGRIRTYKPYSGNQVYSGIAAVPPLATGTISTVAQRVVWLLESEKDLSGNEMTFSYTQELGSGTWNPGRIEYTSNGATVSHRYVQFEYEDVRSDVAPRYQAGVLYRNFKRLKAIAMHAPNPATTAQVWRYELGYKPAGNKASLLTSVRRCNPASTVCTRSKVFDWNDPAISSTFTSSQFTLPRPVNTNTGGNWIASGSKVGDFDGDGVDDLIYALGGNKATQPSTAHNTYIRWGKRGSSPLGTTEKLPFDSIHINESRVTDLDGDGKAEYAPLERDSGSNSFYEYDVETEAWKAYSSLLQPDAKTNFGDFNGDGLLDVINDNDPAKDTYAIRLNAGGGTFGPEIATTWTNGSPDPNSPVVNCGSDVRIVDVNGDGRAEVLGGEYKVNGGVCEAIGLKLMSLSGSVPVKSPASSVVGGKTYYTALSDESVPSGDFNGDGLLDSLVRNSAGAYLVAWNTGAGLELDDSAYTMSGSTPQVADLNGDGLADVVTAGASARTIYYSHGDGTFTTSTLAGVCTVLCTVGDFNGDGLADMVRVPSGNLDAMYLETQNAVTDGARNLIKSVQDSDTDWAGETVVYSSMWTDHPENLGDYTCTYPLVCERRAMTVVRRVDSRGHNVDKTAAQASVRSVYYSYEDPVSDRRGRGSLGFGTMLVWDPARPMESVTEFAHRTVEDGKYYPGVNRPASVTTVVPILKTEDGKPASATARVTRTTYGRETQKPEPGATNTVYAVFDTSSNTKEWEETVSLDWATAPASTHVTGISDSPDPVLRETDTASEYKDGYGNLTKDTIYIHEGTTQQVVIGHDNRVSASDWLTDLPTTVAMTSAEYLAETVTRTTENHYDDKGRLDKAYVEKNSADKDLKETIDYSYDGMGLLTKSVVTPGDDTLPVRESHLEYASADPAWFDEKIYPSQVWSQHDTAAYRPSTWTAIHPAFGVPIATEDVNGRTTKATYDAFGRVLKLSADGESDTTMSYAQRPDAGGKVGTTVTTVHNGVTTTSGTDGWGRTIEGGTSAFDGTTSTSGQAFDVLGRVIAAKGLGATANAYQYYDSLSRLVKTVSPDAKATVYTHPGMFNTTVTDPENNVRQELRDVNGRITSSIDVKGTGASATPITTRYEYAPFDQMSKVTDEKGNVTSMKYDVRGRRTELTDPDKGLTKTAYTGTGEVRSESHQASGHSTSFVYDDLGRKTSSTSEDGLSSFVWDTATGGIGHLAHATSPDSVKTAFRYDSYGRPAGTDTTDLAASVTYSTDQDFNPDGTPNTFTYPDAGGKRFKVSFGYQNGFANKVSDVTGGQAAKALWTVASRKPTMALATATLGNGTGSVSLRNTYENLSDRLQNMTATSGPTGPKLMDLTYGYYDNGLVKTRVQNDTRGARDETFGYDTLGRVTSWDLITAKEQNFTYGYDSLGNQTTSDSSGDLGSFTTTRAYGKAGGSQPHTLTGVTRTCPTGKSCPNDTPVYDNEGRQTSGNGRTQVTYTAFDLPRTIVKGGVTTTYKYDAFGQRVKESTPSATTFTVPGIFEKRTAGTATTYISHLRGTDGPIGQAVTKGATTEIQYQLTDALGSSSATVTATGTSPAAVTQSFYYDPYGVRTNSDGSPFTGTTSDTTRGFTYHEHDDDLGLINMNGRIFDPTQAGFLTPDPIIANPYSGQDWNPYTYVRNTPLNYTDPTGYIPGDGGLNAPCIHAGDAGCRAPGDGDGGGGAPAGGRNGGWGGSWADPHRNSGGNTTGNHDTVIKLSKNKNAAKADGAGIYDPVGTITPQSTVTSNLGADVCPADNPGCLDEDGTPTAEDYDPVLTNDDYDAACPFPDGACQPHDGFDNTVIGPDGKPVAVVPDGSSICDGAGKCSQTPAPKSREDQAFERNTNKIEDLGDLSLGIGSGLGVAAGAAATIPGGQPFGALLGVGALTFGGIGAVAKWAVKTLRERKERGLYATPTPNSGGGGAGPN